MYRHALPPGFVLKKKTEDDALRNQISLEEFLEVCVSFVLALPLPLSLSLSLPVLSCVLSRLDASAKKGNHKLTDPGYLQTASDTSWTSPS
jgi:hypothetical protein